MYSTSHIDQTIANLRDQIAAHESQLHILKEQLAQAEDRARHIHGLIQSHDLEQAYRGGFMPEWQQETWDVLGNGREADKQDQKTEREGERKKRTLELEEYKRYGRQLILPDIGLEGQLKLKDDSVCIIGAGGLGCPAAAYLAGAGVGTIGLVDGDTVEVSNLHRQILHTTHKVGMLKVDSVSKYIQSLNPNVNVSTYPAHLSPTTALSILRPYSLVLDCTDTPQSRYLISDACVLLGKPLVSASALRTDGQLMVLNNPPHPPGNANGGPCYRCVFPRPPPPESVLSCGEGGILGPVVGVMGVLQALEAIKIITAGIPGHLPKSATSTPDPDIELQANKDGVSEPSTPPDPPNLLLFSASASPPFRSIRLRTRRATCTACSVKATITPDSLESGALDYAQFCGTVDPVNVLQPDERISASQYAVRMKQQQQRVDDAGLGRKEAGSGWKHVLVDVRDPTQFGLCQLPKSTNIPISDLVSPQALRGVEEGNRKALKGFEKLDGEGDVVVVCRFGNDSQLAVQKIRSMGLGQGRKVVDIKGGLRAWREEVDQDFPEY